MNLVRWHYYLYSYQSSWAFMWQQWKGEFPLNRKSYTGSQISVTWKSFERSWRGVYKQDRLKSLIPLHQFYQYEWDKVPLKSRIFYAVQVHIEVIATDQNCWSFDNLKFEWSKDASTAAPPVCFHTRSYNLVLLQMSSLLQTFSIQKWFLFSSRA